MYRLPFRLSVPVFFGLITLTFFQTGCRNRCERVDGARERFEIPLGGVHSLDVRTAADVEIRTTIDSADGIMEVFAQPEVYFALESRFRDSTLRFNSDACFRGQEELLISALMRDVKEVRMDAAGEIRSSDLLELDSLSIINQGLGDIALHISTKEVTSRSSASGNVILSGETKKLFAVNTGSGELSGFNLFADTVIIENYGSGVIEVHASEFLQVNFAQETTVRYRGNPRVITVAGTGDLVNANLGR